jgi:AcrR family transcriptional regulator
MPRPRARLDPAAVTLAFAPDGLHGATSADVARCAGVAKPTVYAHGGSKEGVFLACVEAEVERLLSELADADLQTRSLPARARIAALAEAILEHGRRHPASARLLHITARHRASRVADDVDAALARLPARMAALLRHDTTPGCADRVAPALFGAAAALAVARAAADPGRDAAMLGRAFAAVLEPPGERPAEDGIRTVGLY